MLIPCDRHRPEDLALWTEIEAADRIHGARPQLAAKVGRSLAVIREFVDNGLAYASVSWGKDSLVLAHLLWRAFGPNSPVRIYHISPIPTANPYNVMVMRRFLERFPMSCTVVEPDYRRITRGPCVPVTFAEAFRWIARDAGTARYVSGLRADESGGRRIRMRRWGLASVNACAPLGWWSGRDVFGYMAVHDLPVHPNYAMLGGGRWSRERLRVDELFEVGADGKVRAATERGSQYGRAEWENEFYGDLLRRMEAKSWDGPAVAV